MDISASPTHGTESSASGDSHAPRVLGTMRHGGRRNVRSINDPGGGRKKRGLPKTHVFFEKLPYVSLVFGAPWVLFLAPPIYSILHNAATTARGLTPYDFIALVIMIILGATYIATWIISPHALKTPDPTIPVIACFTVTLLSQISLCLLHPLFSVETVPSDIGNFGLCCMAYPLSMVMFQFPRRFFLVGLALLGSVLAVECLTLVERPSAPYFALLVPVLFLFFIIRINIESDYVVEKKHHRELELAGERERLRMGADMHDILGHSLTAITIKADLVKRLLDSGHVDDARAHLDQVTTMSRQALSDVRALVNATRSMVPLQEINSARALLDGLGVDVTLVIVDEPAPGIDSTLIAHTVRESITNALKHAHPHSIHIEMTSHSVMIINDGIDSASQHLHSRTSTGLSALRERVGDFGTLTWGLDPLATNWVVTLNLGG